MTKLSVNLKVGLITILAVSIFLTVYFMKFTSDGAMPHVREDSRRNRKTYIRPVHDITTEWNNTRQASAEHVEYFLEMAKIRGLQSRLGVQDQICDDTDAGKELQGRAYSESESSLCSSQLWRKRNTDFESTDYLDYARCTPYVMSNVSTLDCIESRRFPRNCALPQHRFCRGTNMIFTRARRWQFYAPSGSSTEFVRYCLGTEIDGGNDASLAIVPATHQQCKRRVNRSTFYFGRYVTHKSAYSYQFYHSIHGGVASLFATILETDPSLLDLKTMKMKRDKIQIMLMTRARHWDDPNTPEMHIFNMMSDVPIMYEEDIAKDDFICFDNAVIGLSNRLYIERRDIRMAYSVIKRRYMKLFREFVLANLPALQEADYQKYPFLKPKPEDEPLVIFSRRKSGEIIQGRSALNEQDIVHYLTDPTRYKYAKYVHAVDFATMTGPQQLHTLSKPSTIFTGMFGAAFTHLYWMNPKASIAIIWKNEAIRNRIYHVIADLVEIQMRDLVIYREQCSYDPERIREEFKDYERRKTIEFYQPENHFGFMYTRDLTCYLDMEKMEVLITAAIDSVFNHFKCDKKK